jgi:hypothetical protein
MSSSEVVGVGVLAFSFTLHSYFVRITCHMSMKCSSLSFSATSSLILCALIHWILLLWLGMRPGGHQRGARAVPGAIALEGFFCPEAEETGWSSLAAAANWSQLLSWFLPSSSKPCSVLLPPPLDFSLCRALLCHRLNTCSSSMFSLDCPLVDRQRVHPLVLLARADDQELMLLPRKSDGLVWHSRLSDFPVLGLPCPTGGRHVRNGRLLCKSLCSQNLQ